MKNILKNNVFQKFLWVTNRLLGLIICYFAQIFIKKNKNLLLFGCKLNPSNKEHFINNTKYLFLQIQKEKNIKSIWLCDDKKMTKEFKNKGYTNVISRRSLKGIWAILKAKYWFSDSVANQVSQLNCSLSSVCIISFWHGAGGLKKVGYDAQDSQYDFKKNSLQDKIYSLLKSKIDYWVVNSQFEANCRKSAFLAKDNEIKLLGSPRLDVLYKDIPNAEIFMEKDFENIKTFKQQGKKLIIYMPTFRDTGKDISGWLQSEKLQKVLTRNNIILLCKLHPFDRTVLNFGKDTYIYKIANDSDVYPILKYTDGLITDYSSIYFDYLHLDKPIIYHIPDIDEYTQQCRGFYRPYETLTAGVYTQSEEELLNAIEDVANGVDNYIEQRKKLLDEMFVYQDGNNCERVIEWIKGLDK